MAMVRPGAVTISGTLVAASGSVRKCWIIAATIGNIETIAKIGRKPAATRVIPWGFIVRLLKKRRIG
ncbi:alcohol dehydrogenase, iron-dependent, partial [Novosphingobium sp. PY1]